MIRALVDARRPARVLVLAAVLSTVSLTLAAVPALAADPDPTTTTVPATEPTTTTVPPEETTTTTLPPEETTTTTVPPEETTTTTLPPEETTTTTVPPDDTTTTTEPPAEENDFTPDETLPPHPAFVTLTSGQRAVLQQLQTANDTLATRYFALIGLAQQLDVAKDHLDAARDHEHEVVEREIIGLLGPAIDRNDATEAVAERADAALAPFRDGRRKSAKRERDACRPRPSVDDLNSQIAAQAQVVSDAKAEKDDAESAVTGVFGSGSGLRVQADGITATLATAQAGQPDPLVVAGMEMPIPGAHLGSPFGIRIDPLGGGAGLHPGVDFEAVSGTQIHAAAAGVVVMAGDCGGYGYCVVIDHGSSIATLYGHQSQLLTHVGDHVDAGQVIGLVGSTGAVNGPPSAFRGSPPRHTDGPPANAHRLTPRKRARSAPPQFVVVSSSCSGIPYRGSRAPRPTRGATRTARSSCSCRTASARPSSTAPRSTASRRRCSGSGRCPRRG